MNQLCVYIEMKGKQIHVGNITQDSPQIAYFQYSPDYLQLPQAAHISLSLPLQKEPFDPIRTKNYFEGLLPEGFTRKSVAQWMRADEMDYLTILHGLGQECLGAIKILSPNQQADNASYELLSSKQVKELAEEGATLSSQMVTKAHLSLTGASGKVGLYYDKENDQWYQPHGDAPSTYIVKQSHVRLDGIVANEQLALTTASLMGIDTPESFIINLGDARDEDVLFATRRYDRVAVDSGRTLNGIVCPLRLHQEDFGQALCIPPAEKYERAGQNYMRRMFELLKNQSANPIQDQMKLWDIIIFNFLIGNTDNHVKNYSLLYTEDLKKVRLAPAYDIISTSIYESCSREMAFHIGGNYQLSEISRESFRQAARDVGLGERLALRRFDHLCSIFEESLNQATELMIEKRFTNASAIRDRILQTSGYAGLN